MSSSDQQPVPSDYCDDDGWNDDNGIEQCPHCNALYTANQGYTGPVYDQDGTRYGSLHDTSADDGPFFCADCWPILKSNANQQTHIQLTDF